MAFVSEHVLDCCSFAPPSRSMRALRVGAIAALASLSLAACKKPAPPAQKPAVDVTAVTVTAQSTPVDFEFTAQTQSSREVEIRARVDGFLEKRMYTEGALVSANQVMFLMDKRPFEAALQTAKGSLAQQQARLLVTQQNLARVKPLAAMNALSKKDLDDAIGNEKSAEAAVIAAKGEVQTAELNLSYTTIRSPLKGLSSFARIQEGSYVTPTQGGLLTYVYQLDPMWVNFSISENELLGYREQIKKGELRFPPDNKFDVTVIQADGSVFPQTGRIDFTNPAFSTETGTFLVRAVFANPQGTLRPGQFVKARVAGAVRPNAILVPQRAVLQGAKSHFVWVLDEQSKPHQRVVEVGEWHGDDWFITNGLKAGERVIVDGAIRVGADTQVRVVAAPAAGGAAASGAQEASLGDAKNASGGTEK
ncbi:MULTISPECIES: efflux RND transporter periplasmic adaptor subunit [Caballeronia]|uniref:efflux RND transporter periplasmic adaptor subunit n=1 Tax=Caballeronia TaxID=1827195 RepID=UPI00025B99E9|nr:MULTISPECIES: efflux RND transporter periplasmic adaptor subunit [Caballeronia]EKS70140.1 RND family efflux transporter MFP subunit [Burkholderia sp. SJ98]MCG7400898.1 efflux RND transporter periplasmic adaptor subunit [Caballeronia zhejiangensis]MCI1043404.1 efflux RND transporter periplasmic adaptor subunit [Caballeronia zhejiangensis]MDR5790831.1 efflux RND transporter periplasmic adaptor subunit [Caballeronia sp. LP003]